ncbi:hypothetical protein DICVIV_03669 [Dictyocaulus viviparus]|uniref:Uncharacterized protein n=1 Tax=Dictyocaulus viviparus TaxID=29172 RepID=A0A0D8Y6E3_DICVI|nr:hypothetical protein DICVIV_03669 [Dictyocaulus viviparus]
MFVNVFVVAPAVLEPLNAYTKSLVDRTGQLISITGTAFDYNYNGIADSEMSSSPSHLYRILISCLGGWSTDGASCLEPSKMIALSFIIPHIEKDKNEDLLLEYTARIRDVELISGLQLHFPHLSNTQQLWLKTHINLQLWLTSCKLLNTIA